MAWSEHIHIHIHDDSKEILLQILAELKKINCGDVIPQEIMDKLDQIVADIKSTIK